MEIQKSKERKSNNRVAPAQFSSVNGLGVERFQRFRPSILTVPQWKGSLCISVELERTLRLLVSVSVAEERF